MAMTAGWAQGFAAVDWGSSARRIYVLDADGAVVRQEEDAAGTLTILKERSQPRSKQYANVSVGCRCCWRE
jgi:2-keto-3-deoxy-galactonokinase